MYEFRWTILPVDSFSWYVTPIFSHFILQNYAQFLSTQQNAYSSILLDFFSVRSRLSQYLSHTLWRGIQFCKLCTLCFASWRDHIKLEKIKKVFCSFYSNLEIWQQIFSNFRLSTHFYQLTIFQIPMWKKSVWGMRSRD